MKPLELKPAFGKLNKVRLTTTSCSHLFELENLFGSQPKMYLRVFFLQIYIRGREWFLPEYILSQVAAIFYLGAYKVVDFSSWFW